MTGLGEWCAEHAGKAGGIAGRAEALVRRFEAAVVELRAERHRQDAVLMQLQAHEAAIRNAVEALNALAAVPGHPICTCPSRGLSVVLRGGFCAECMGRV